MPRTPYIISGKDTEILEALGRYKFLTVSQMVDLGIMKDRSNLRKRLKALRERKRSLIGHIPFAGAYKFQQREYVYYLSKRGAQSLVIDLGWEEGSVRYPIGTSSMYNRDYEHRKHFIDLQILLYQWTERHGIEVVFFEAYTTLQNN